MNLAQDIFGVTKSLTKNAPRITRNLRPSFCGSENNPAKSPPNFPQDFPAKRKIQRRAFVCRSAGRTTCPSLQLRCPKRQRFEFQPASNFKSQRFDSSCGSYPHFQLFYTRLNWRFPIENVSQEENPPEENHPK